MHDSETHAHQEPPELEDFEEIAWNQGLRRKPRRPRTPRPQTVNPARIPASERKQNHHPDARPAAEFAESKVSLYVTRFAAPGFDS